MAYTFSEAQDVIKNAEQQGLGGYVGTSLVVTQHDSRTAWSRGRLFRYADDTLGNLFHIADVTFSFYTKFSDRNVFAGQADLVGANVVRVGAGPIPRRSRVVLLGWNPFQR